MLGPRRRARLVVLGIEVGGRMSTEMRSFLTQLAKARARQETPLMRKRAEQAWRMRWGAILSCTTARAVASFLLNVQSAVGADGDTPPTHEVERDIVIVSCQKKKKRCPVPGVGSDPSSVHEVLRKDRCSFLCEDSLIAPSSVVEKKIQFF